MKGYISVYWFRQDLRLTDNPALVAAIEAGSVIPIYILDDENAKAYSMGSASRLWLHNALNSLNDTLSKKLNLYVGDPKKILLELIKENNVQAVYWNRCYEPWQVKRDKVIKSTLGDQGIEVYTCNGSLLWEPWEIKKKDDTPYRVFTPFYRKGCLKAVLPRTPIPQPKKLGSLLKLPSSQSLLSLKLHPKKNWCEIMEKTWEISEAGAHNKLETFLEDRISDYKEGRNFPAKHSVSQLSPYLHFGQISPNQAWYAALVLSDDGNVDCFCSELGWREFSYSLLYYNQELPQKNLQVKFDRFPWRDDKAALKMWQGGRTGVPIVDAGMRELWQTGYMHNRIRMIVGSFLVKNLLLHWHNGERWFWDCLVDADLASNSASWQWVAGCGADAAPYFRIFNPVLQGQKFDAKGVYTRQFVPELKDLPDKYLFNPWEAPKEVLDKAGVRLGETYPYPIVDLKVSRQRALKAFRTLKI